MATKTQVTNPTAKGASAAKQSTTAVAHPAKAELGAPAALADDILADAGKGMQNIDADSVAIPFLAVLQTNSPQVDADEGEYVPGAKPGMFFNTVTKEVFDGKTGLLVIPCEYQRKWLRWQARETGGGFKGELRAEEVTKMRQSGALVEQDNRLYVPDENGNVNPKKSDKVSDTRVHYVLVLNPRTGVAQHAVVSLGSTQIKKSKQLMSLLSGVTMENPATGQRVNPPTFVNLVRVTTVPESNDKGKWHGVGFALEGFIQDRNTYSMARGFHQLVGGGKATVNYEAAPGGGGDGEGDEPGKF